jgi:uncharacterized protein (DUF305 family)
MKFQLKALGSAFAVAALLMSGAALKANDTDGKNKNEFDNKFMQKVLDHHQGGLDMGKVAEAKAPHSDWKDMNRRMADVDKTQMRKMKDWLTGWYGVNHQPRAKGKWAKETRKLDKLDGEKFEKKSLQDMIAHHREGLKAVKPCPEKAKHSDLRDLCGEMTELQTKELAEMQDMLCRWYQDCKGKNR